MTCPRCNDTGWVCEEHPDKPMDHMVDGKTCAVGMPCPDCNEGDAKPRLPPDFIPERGQYIGKRIDDGDPHDEREHFIRCPTCNGWIDMRDLAQVFEHEGPLPHPAQDKPQ